MWDRHLEMHHLLWDGLKSMGLKPFVEKDEDRCAKALHGFSVSCLLLRACVQAADVMVMMVMGFKPVVEMGEDRCAVGTMYEASVVRRFV